MANEIANAVALLKNADFRDWVMAASVYQAALIMQEQSTVENHAIRISLADAVITNPSLHLDRFVNVISCSQDIASLGTTPEAVTQNALLTKVAAIWTSLAIVIYS